MQKKVFPQLLRYCCLPIQKKPTFQPYLSFFFMKLFLLLFFIALFFIAVLGVIEKRRLTQQDFKSTCFTLSVSNQFQFTSVCCPLVAPHTHSFSPRRSNVANCYNEIQLLPLFLLLGRLCFFFPSRLQQALLDCCHNFNFPKTSCRWTAKQKLFLQQVHVSPASNS